MFGSQPRVLLARFCGVVTLRTLQPVPGGASLGRGAPAAPGGGGGCPVPPPPLCLCVWLRGPRARRVPAETERAAAPAVRPLRGCRCGPRGPVRGCRRGPRGAGRGRGRSAPPPRRCRSAVRCRRGRPGGAAAGRCGGLGRGGSERARLAAARARRPPALPGRTREIPLAMQTRRRLLPPEVSERCAARRPRAREAGALRSPGPRRPQRGPAGGRAGRAPAPRWSRRIADSALGLPAPGAPEPRRPCPRHATKGKAAVAPQPSPAAAVVLRAPSPPFPLRPWAAGAVTRSPGAPFSPRRRCRGWRRSCCSPRDAPGAARGRVRLSPGSRGCRPGRGGSLFASRALFMA